jgi:hypothetical protein
MRQGQGLVHLNALVQEEKTLPTVRQKAAI